jgi:hypothetical protein
MPLHNDRELARITLDHFDPRRQRQAEQPGRIDLGLQRSRLLRDEIPDSAGRRDPRQEHGRQYGGAQPARIRYRHLTSPDDAVSQNGPGGPGDRGRFATARPATVRHGLVQTGCLPKTGIRLGG